MPNVSLKPNKSRAFAAQLVLRIALGLLSLCFLFEMYRYSMWSKIIGGVYLSHRSIVLVELLELAALLIQFILTILTAVFFLRWMYRCYENLSKIKELKRDPSWVFLSWIIPVVNLFMPLLVITEAVMGYENILIKEQFLRKKEFRTSLAIWWWVTLVSGTICAILGLQSTPMLQVIPESLFYRVISILFFIISTILAIRMISDLKMMEEGVSAFDHVSLKAKNSEDILDSDI